MRNDVLVLNTEVKVSSTLTSLSSVGGKAARGVFVYIDTMM